MKKIIVLSIVLVAFIGQSNVMAQEKGKIRLGAALALGTKSAIDADTGESKLGFGINIGGDYFITDAISLAPSYTFFFESSIEELGITISLKTSSFNIDGKYYFLRNEVAVYGLIGLSIANAKATVDFQGTPISASDSSTGLNIGGGVDFYLGDKAYLNGQVKYNTPLEQLVINFGVGFVLN